VFFHVRAMSRSAPSTLFPYTTLFRSIFASSWLFSFFPIFLLFRVPRTNRIYNNLKRETGFPRSLIDIKLTFKLHYLALFKEFHRSEEHTSELQSRENLVCRLLLEKKK